MISLSDIHFAYDASEPLFDGLNLEIEAGQSFGLLGPNGSGKTTLISIIAGVRSPMRGTVRIGGQSYSGDRARILSDIAVVPQDLALYPNLSVHENLRFFLGLYAKTDAARASASLDRAIELTQLGRYTARRAGQLSGGLKRRLNLAIGLINFPSLLILDEPAVGIDPQSRHFILEAVKTLNQEGTTVVYTSHYLEEVEAICSRAAIIDAGKILIDREIEALLSTEHDAEVTFEHPICADTLEENLARFVDAHGIRLRDRTAAARGLAQGDLRRFLELAEGADLVVASIQYGRRTLADVYFELTRTRLREH